MNLGKILIKQRQEAYQKNLNNILELIEPNKDAKILDLGCDDGKWTKIIGKKSKSKYLFGIELVKSRAITARKNGIKVSESDLNKKFPYKKETFNLVHSNQVIEHLSNTDNFLSEIHRILKPGGYVITSTENLASWHNIAALLLGYTPFSLTNITSKTGALGNPLAPHHGENFWETETWQHQRVFTLKGLNHLFNLHGFKIESSLGAGYYPFGNTFSNVDKRHAAFIALKARKL